MNLNARDDTPGLVELQLLRHGPPHNQLLSPLTDYLALCGDHPNTTLRIPLEHAALETRLRALRYFDSEETRLDQLRETARIASELLAKVPGLIAELSADRGDGAPFVHLSIVSRASELALFPFELAVSPDGLPGAGQALVLQKQMPVCLTRRSRNIRNDSFVWDRPVKILMVASDAGGEIPVMQHYALLRKLVEPWVGTMPAEKIEPGGQGFELREQKNRQRETEEAQKRRLRGVLHLLTDASVEAIARTLTAEVDDTREPFTHIHVLAHGCDLPDTDRRSGIALHHPTRPGVIDAVDGKRLALTLGCLPDYPEEGNRYQGPAVVTLATCSSADQASVKISGASLAFDLHDSGIPLVVGSQFPLTAEGSIIMTDALYTGFLAGCDPRSTVWEARRALLTNFPQKPRLCTTLTPSAHDWASMTVYSALPANLDEILPSHWSKRNKRRLDVRLENVHRLSRSIGLILQTSIPEDLWRKAADDAIAEAEFFARWTETLENVDEATRVSNSGILASAQKQIGLLLINAAFDLRPGKQPPGKTVKEWEREVFEQREVSLKEGENWLRKSRAEYRRIFQSTRDKTWALVQSLAIEFALRADFDEADWAMAQRLAQMDEYAHSLTGPADGRDRRGNLAAVLLHERAQTTGVRVDAWVALLELEFLHCLKAAFQDETPVMHTDAMDLAKRILRVHEERRDGRIPVLSGIRQFQRYRQFAKIAYFASKARDDKDRLQKYWDALMAHLTANIGSSGQGKPRLKHILEGNPGQAVDEIEAILDLFVDVN